MALFLPPWASMAKAHPPSQARMVGVTKNFSETQGPEDLQNRSQPAQRLSGGIGLTGPRQPRNDVAKGLAHKGSRRLAGIQTVSPAAERGGIGDAIGVFEGGRRLFPGAVILKTPSQRLTAGQLAVVGVGERR